MALKENRCMKYISPNFPVCISLSAGFRQIQQIINIRCIRTIKGKYQYIQAIERGIRGTVRWTAGQQVE